MKGQTVYVATVMNVGHPEVSVFSTSALRDQWEIDLHKECRKTVYFSDEVVDQYLPISHYDFYGVGSDPSHSSLLGGGDYHSDAEAKDMALEYGTVIGRTIERVLCDDQKPPRIVWQLRV